MNDDVCRLIKALSTTGPSLVPLRPCCTAALVAMHDRDRPDGAWLCPFEEDESVLALAPHSVIP